MVEIKGPEPKLAVSVCHGGMNRAVVSLDDREIPMQVKQGFTQSQCLFGSSKFRCARIAKHDASLKVYRYLNSKFGINIADLSYEKIKSVSLKCSESKLAIDDAKTRSQYLLTEWGKSIDRLDNLCKRYAGSSIAIKKDVAEKILSIKNEMTSFFSHESDKLMTTVNDHNYFMQKTSGSFVEVISSKFCMCSIKSVQ